MGVWEYGGKNPSHTPNLPHTHTSTMPPDITRLLPIPFYPVRMITTYFVLCSAGVSPRRSTHDGYAGIIKRKGYENASPWLLAKGKDSIDRFLDTACLSKGITNFYAVDTVSLVG